MRTIHSSFFKRLGSCIIAALILFGIHACGGGGSGDGLSSPTPSSQGAPGATFMAYLVTAPENGATISGTVNFEVAGSNIANVELLPSQGYAPKLAVFTVSDDKTTATATLDTTKQPDGMLVARISAFDTPAGSSTASEIIAMPVRTWTIKNGAKPDPGVFSATLAAAPANGATVAGVVTLEVTGSGMKNVELLPSEGYVPKYATFAVSPDGTKATATLDTTKLPDGAMVSRIVAFDAPAGQPANQIGVMPARTWNIKNQVTPAEFSAQVANAPADGAAIAGTVRLEVTGSGIQNVELLPQSGYTPKYATFSVSEDKTKATVDFDTTKLTNGSLAVRISAFDAPAGSSSTSEIVVLNRTWRIQNGWTVTDLGITTADDSRRRAITGINDAGQITGNYANADGSYRGYLYTAGQITDLGQATPLAINNSGQIVGNRDIIINTTTSTQAFLYQNGQFSSLNLPSWITGSRATAINDAGDIAGVIYYGSTPYIGPTPNIFIYSSAGRFTNLERLGLPTTGNTEFFEIAGINSTQQLAVNLAYWKLNFSYLYSNGTATSLGRRSDNTAPYFSAQAYAMNNKGEIAGYSQGGFLYADGIMKGIGTLFASRALGINDKSQVVGVTDGQFFLYDNGNMRNLSELAELKEAGYIPSTTDNACKINNLGQIACNGTKNGERRAFLLTPPAQ